MSYDADLVVIGSGPAGEKAAAQAGYFGKRVIVVERAPQPGGTAVHTGTLPSKTLRETALFLAGHRQRELYGVSVTIDTGIAVQKMLGRNAAVSSAEAERAAWNLRRHGIEYIRGAARLLDGHRVEVTTATGIRVVSGEFVLIATGSAPYHPPEIDFSLAGVDDSDSILAIEGFPRRLAVLGGGVVGAEYASTFAELGVAVTLIEPRDHIVPFLDHEVRDGLAEAMRANAVDIILGNRWTGVRKTDRGLAVELPGGERVVVDQVLVAAGRVGATARLGLAELGVEVTNRGYVVVDDRYRTTVPSILAAGDAIGFPALASTAMEQGRVAVCNAFGFEYKQHVSALSTYGVYTIPEVGCVGLTEDEARAADIDVVCGRAAYGQNARAQILGAKVGWVKLVFDRTTRELLGVHILGEGAAELVHTGQAVIALHGTVETFIAMVFNSPTLSECYKYAAYDALGQWREEIHNPAFADESQSRP